MTRRTTKDALETVEDKPLTPLRRSARVKSNTSIASDTAITTAGDTTRAKRVTRNSQLGLQSFEMLICFYIVYSIFCFAAVLHIIIILMSICLLYRQRQ